MMHSSSATSARSSLSFAPRAVVFAPALLAALSLCSLARAEESAAPASTNSATPEPSALPLPVAAPSANAADAQPTAPTASSMPTDRAVAPAPLAPASAVTVGSLHLPRVHQGFYLRLSSGPGLLTLSGHGPSGASASISDSGASGSLAIGGAIVPGLVLAGTLSGTGFNAKFKGGPFADATVSANGQQFSASRKAEGGFGMIGLLVDWYPQPTGSWHAGFSTGLGAIGLTNSADDSDLGGANFAGSVFGGYDWSLGQNWALGLQLMASGGTTTKLREDFDTKDGHDSGYRLTPFSVGVQASLLYF